MNKQQFNDFVKDNLLSDFELSDVETYTSKTWLAEEQSIADWVFNCRINLHKDYTVRNEKMPVGIYVTIMLRNEQRINYVALSEISLNKANYKLGLLRLAFVEIPTAKEIIANVINDCRKDVH